MALPLVFAFGCSDSGIPQASNDVEGEDSLTPSISKKVNTKNNESDEPVEPNPSDVTPSPPPVKKTDILPPSPVQRNPSNEDSRRRVEQKRRDQSVPKTPASIVRAPITRVNSGASNKPSTNRTQTIKSLTAAPVTLRATAPIVRGNPVTIPKATYVGSKPENANLESTTASYPVESISGIRRLTDDEMAKRLGSHLKDLKNYLLQNHKQITVRNQTVQLNDEVAFFIDMKVSSGFYRFFVIDLKSDEILERGRVAHGIGSGKGSIPTVFSNVSESKQTSLGKYIVSEGYTGKWGWSYRLDGLESTNSKARDRAIVLHRPGYYLKNDQRFFQDTFHSDGCAMVASDFFETLEDKYIKPSREEGKSTLLYIYY